MAETPQPPRFGGRALRNGVMMVGPKSIGVAIRRQDGQIATAVEPFSVPGAWSRKIPFIRGLITFPGMILLARKAAKLESRLNQGGSKVRATVPQFAPGVGAVIADRLTRELSRRADRRLVLPIEAVAGVTLPFVAFGLSGYVPGVRELWRYHGAEHKAVHAAEAGLDLTPQNAAGMSRIHPRCGTVFAFFGLLGGTLAKAYIAKMPNGRRKAIAGALSGPLIISAAFEAVRLGNTVKNNSIGRAIFTPAWQAQRFTTAEPDERELEVAVAALQVVIDYEQAHA